MSACRLYNAGPHGLLGWKEVAVHTHKDCFDDGMVFYCVAWIAGSTEQYRIMSTSLLKYKKTVLCCSSTGVTVGYCVGTAGLLECKGPGSLELLV